MVKLRSMAHLWSRLTILVLIFLITASFVLFSADEKPTLSQTLSDLLTGKNSNIQVVLSSAEDRQIPLVLAVCNLLKFRAVHKEIPLSAVDVEKFEKALNDQVVKSTQVSWSKNRTCTIPIFAQEIAIAGNKITVPAHFIAPQKFEITGFSPTDEAGTLLPEICVSFAGALPPITAKILLTVLKSPPSWLVMPLSIVPN